MNKIEDRSLDFDFSESINLTYDPKMDGWRELCNRISINETKIIVILEKNDNDIFEIQLSTKFEKFFKEVFSVHNENLRADNRNDESEPFGLVSSSYVTERSYEEILDLLKSETESNISSKFHYVPSIISSGDTSNLDIVVLDITISSETSSRMKLEQKKAKIVLYLDVHNSLSTLLSNSTTLQYDQQLDKEIEVVQFKGIKRS